MIVLGLDTTGPDCSVSIVDEATVLAHISENIGRGHAEVLAGMVTEAFEAAGLAPHAIDRLAVCTGPGSFTGLRVALSFAIGFAMPREVPVIGINALTLASQQSAPEQDKTTVVLKDIRRNEVMFATYSGFNCLSGSSPRTGTKSDARQEAEHFRAPMTEVGTIDTRILAWLAINLNPADYPPEPLYSRGPDAKLPGGASPRKA